MDEETIKADNIINSLLKTYPYASEYGNNKGKLIK